MTMMSMVLIIKDSDFDDYDDNEEGYVRAENIFETNRVNKKNKAEKLCELWLAQQWEDNNTSLRLSHQYDHNI